MDALTTVVFIFSYVFFLLIISIAENTISINQLIRDGDTINSAGGSFELGVFSPGNSKNQYFGYGTRKCVMGLWYGLPIEKVH